MCSVHGIQFSSLAASNFTTAKSVCGFLLGLILLMKEINLFQPLLISSVASQYVLKTRNKGIVGSVEFVNGDAAPVAVHTWILGI